MITQLFFPLSFAFAVYTILNLSSYCLKTNLMQFFNTCKSHNTYSMGSRLNCAGKGIKLVHQTRHACMHVEMTTTFISNRFAQGHKRGRIIEDALLSIKPKNKGGIHDCKNIYIFNYCLFISSQKSI